MYFQFISKHAMFKYNLIVEHFFMHSIHNYLQKMYIYLNGEHIHKQCINKQLKMQMLQK